MALKDDSLYQAPRDPNSLASRNSDFLRQDVDWMFTSSIQFLYGSIWVWFIVGSFRNGMLSLSKITGHCARCLKANETQSKDPLGSCDILGIRPVKLIACHVLRPSCCFIPHWEVLIWGQGNAASRWKMIASDSLNIAIVGTAWYSQTLKEVIS